MMIGMCKITLRIPENASLKGKRHVVKSIIARLKNRFDVSVAEVENNDLWQTSTIGVSCVSNDRRHANQVLSHVINFVEGNAHEAELMDYEIEIIAY